MFSILFLSNSTTNGIHWWLSRSKLEIWLGPLRGKAKCPQGVGFKQRTSRRASALTDPGSLRRHTRGCYNTFFSCERFWIRSTPSAAVKELPQKYIFASLLHDYSNLWRMKADRDGWKLAVVWTYTSHIGTQIEVWSSLFSFPFLFFVWFYVMM